MSNRSWDKMSPFKQKTQNLSYWSSNEIILLIEIRQNHYEEVLLKSKQNHKKFWDTKIWRKISSFVGDFSGRMGLKHAQPRPLYQFDTKSWNNRNISKLLIIWFNIYGTLHIKETSHESICPISTINNTFYSSHDNHKISL